jgi:hypothetical protein
VSKPISDTPLRDEFDRVFGSVAKDDKEGVEALFDVFLCGANAAMSAPSGPVSLADAIATAMACKAEIHEYLKTKRREEAERN